MKGRKRPLQEEDLYPICAEDDGNILVERFFKYWVRFEGHRFRFWKTMLYCDWHVFAIVGILGILEALLQLANAVLLGLLIDYFDPNTNGEIRNDLADRLFGGWLGTAGDGHLYAALVSMSVLLCSVIHHQWLFRSTKMGMSLVAMMSAVIYRKLRHLHANYARSGYILNLASNDIEPFRNAFAFFHMLYVGPLQIMLVTYFLVERIEWVATLTGLVTLLCMIPIQIFLSSRIAKYRRDIVSARDTLMRKISDALLGIQVIKYYGWESLYEQYIMEARERLLSLFYRMSWIKTFNESTAYFSSLLVSTVAFLTYYYQGYTLVPSRIFSSLALFFLVQVTITDMFPKAVEFLARAKISVERLEAFLLLPEYDEDASQNSESKDDSDTHGHPDEAEEHNVVVRNATFRYGNIVAACSESVATETAPPEMEEERRSETLGAAGHEAHTLTVKSVASTMHSQMSGASTGIGLAAGFHLSNVNLKVGAGEFVMVIGPVGSGKSTLLQGLLGELKPTSEAVSQTLCNTRLNEDARKRAGESEARGENEGLLTNTSLSRSITPLSSVLPPLVVVRRPIAYCSQASWLFPGTVLDNILIGRPYDATRIARVIQICCLLPDLAHMGHGLHTQLGERGVSLSGGQRARICLARSIYDYHQVKAYLLDDALSAVDNAVGNVILRGLFGLVKETGASCILVTHQTQNLPMADRIVSLRKGKIVFDGSYETFSQLGGESEMEYYGLTDEENEEEEEEEGEESVQETVWDDSEVYLSASLESRPTFLNEGGVFGTNAISTPLAPPNFLHTRTLSFPGVGPGHQSTKATLALVSQDRKDPASKALCHSRLLMSPENPTIALGRSPLKCAVAFGGHGRMRAGNTDFYPLSKNSLAGPALAAVAGKGHAGMPVPYRLQAGRAPTRQSGPVKSNCPPLPGRARHRLDRTACGTRRSGSLGYESAHLKKKKPVAEPCTLEKCRARAIGWQKMDAEEALGKSERLAEDRLVRCILMDGGAMEKGQLGTLASAAMIVSEKRASGAVSGSLYAAFLKQSSYADPLRCILILAIFVLPEALFVFTNEWLTLWSDLSPSEQHQSMYPVLLVILTLLTIVTSIIRATLFFKFVMSACASLFKAMLKCILACPLLFFQSNPMGRILNRFTKDTALIDEELAWALFDASQCFLILLSTIGLICVVNPWTLLAVPPLFFCYWMIRHWYLASSREIKRLESVARSPLYSFLASTIEGLPILRSFGSHLLAGFEHKFIALQNTHTAALFNYDLAGRWMSFWLDIASAFFFMLSTHAAVMLHGSIRAADVGFALSYVMHLIGLVNWCTRQLAEVENMMTSMERIMAYCDLPSEFPPASPKPERLLAKRRSHARSSSPTSMIVERRPIMPPEGWPSEGHIEIKNLNLSYPSRKQPILSGIAVSFSPHEKVAIVGRTGAGKSSFLSAFLRLVEPYPSGCITIDGFNISTLDLAALRKAIAVIPQDPILFSGSIRWNLDPAGAKTDLDLWMALDCVTLANLVRSLPDGLDTELAGSAGSDLLLDDDEDAGIEYDEDDDETPCSTSVSLSMGEKQLLCLARAILRQSSLIFMDEATSNIDASTSAHIHSLVKKAFASANVFTIAHRLQTVIDYDRVMVLDQGRLVECGVPWMLLRSSLESQSGDIYIQNSHLKDDTADRCKSAFAKMIREMGPEAEEKMRKAAYEAHVERLKRQGLWDSDFNVHHPPAYCYRHHEDAHAAARPYRHAESLSRTDSTSLDSASIDTTGSVNSARSLDGATI